MSEMIVRYFTIVVCGVILCATTSIADGGGSRFTPAELEALKAGETVRQELPSSRQGGFYGGTGWVVVDAPADKIWNALVNWRSYPDIFPNIEEMTEVARKGSRSLIKMRLGHPIISVMFHIEMRRDPGRRTLAFELVKNHPHDLDSIKGYWRLFPQAGNRTLVAYVVAFRVPMGIVNLVGSDFEQESMEGILGTPGYLKRWIETGKPN